MPEYHCAAVVGSLLLAWTTLLSGCTPSDEEYASSEESAVKEAVSNFPGPRRIVEGRKSLFVDGSALDEETRKRFAPFMPSVSAVSISENVATIDIELEELATGEIIGPVKWTLEKVEDQWKIKTCPFPQTD